MLEPFGEYQAHFTAGIVASTLANLYKKKGRKPYTPDDFVAPRTLKTRPVVQSVEEQALALRSIASSVNKEGVKKRHRKKRKRKK